MNIIPQTQDEEVEVIETYSNNKLVKLTYNGVPQPLDKTRPIKV